MATLSSKLTSPSLARRSVFFAADGQTVLIGLQYTVNSVDVYLNGAKLIDGEDYTATDGSTITLTDPAVLNDTIEVVSYASLQLADTYSKGDINPWLERIVDLEDEIILDLGVI